MRCKICNNIKPDRNVCEECDCEIAHECNDEPELRAEIKRQKEALLKIAGLCEAYQNRDFDGQDFEYLRAEAYQLTMAVIKVTMEAKP